VYDLFYEPIEGLLDENGSFLHGLSKGGRSLASRTIGGTSGFTSKITGGIGKGVSYLTMDSEFYRNRASRRLPGDPSGQSRQAGASYDDCQQTKGRGCR